MEIDDKLKSNISSLDTWLRFLITLGFGALTSIVMMPVVWVLAGVQLVFLLITGERNSNLHEVHRSLSAWLAQVFSYMLAVSDQKPFPFSDLPELESEEEIVVEDQVEASAPESAKAKSEVEEEPV